MVLYNVMNVSNHQREFEFFKAIKSRPQFWTFNVVWVTFQGLLSSSLLIWNCDWGPFDSNLSQINREVAENGKLPDTRWKWHFPFQGQILRTGDVNASRKMEGIGNKDRQKVHQCSMCMHVCECMRVRESVCACVHVCVCIMETE